MNTWLGNADDKLIFCIIALFIMVVACVWSLFASESQVRKDNRTREQLVERGLAEYVVIDNTGKTEWRWKQ